MKVDLELPRADIAFLHRYASDRFTTLEEAVREAVVLLRVEALGDQYLVAWREWAESGEEVLWDQTTGDGIEDEVWPQ